LRVEGKISILAAGDFNLKGVEKILPVSRYRIVKRKNLSNEDILKYGGRYEVLIINSRRKLDKVFLSRCNIKTICTASKGVDHIDTEYARKRNIRIVNSENGNVVAASEHTFALILGIMKNTALSGRLIAQKRFDFWNYERHNLSGMKIGIIGTGKVGSKVVNIAKAFGMKVLANDIDGNVIRKNKTIRYHDVWYLLRNSDIVTLHIPLTKQNRDFFDSEKFSLLKKNAVFVNTSRGGVVNEKHLIQYLKKRKSFRAGLDVFQNEPFIDDNFRRLKNVFLTNHIAGKTPESEQGILNEILKQVENVYSVKEKNVGIKSYLNY